MATEQLTTAAPTLAERPDVGSRHPVATEQNTNAAPTLPPLVQAWLSRSGLSGKLLAIGGLVGLIAVFLPLLSVSVQLPSVGGKAVHISGFGVSQSVSVIQSSNGVICLLAYLATLGLAYVLYQPSGLRQPALAWAGVGVGAVVALLALWLFISACSGSSSMGGFGSVSVGFGAILNLLAAATVATGGFLKAREERLF